METRPVRFIAVGNRINVQAAATERSFAMELERIVGLAVPHLAKDRPNLVVLGEILGLPLAMTGKRGYIPRRMHTSNVAISMLALGYARRMVHYRRLYLGISLVRSLLLSLSDTLYRPFVTTLSRLAAEHTIYISASTIIPHVHSSTSPSDIGRFGQREIGKVYLPDGPEVYNTSLLWRPDGQLIGTADKIFITESEKNVLDLVPGDLERVQTFATEFGNIGMAISLDAFMPEYLQKLDALGTQIVIQNDANDQLWAAPSKTCEWQPQEWLNSVLGSVQDDYPHLLYNICAMQVGNFFDLIFDGQSSIMKKSDRQPDPYCNFVGNNGFVHTVTGKTMTGEILALSPWIMDDPIKTAAEMSLAERRTILTNAARQRLTGGTHAHHYPESVIWADVGVPAAPVEISDL
ncbi:MAG: nitrilase-related carbon-nitrogen hydrolase [Ktedonobacteraceae bacterium]